MQIKLKKLSRNTELAFNNSKDYMATQNEYLQGEIITIILGSINNLAD